MNALVGPQEVQEAHQREGEILTLTVNGKEIDTTTEHPFWVKDRSWVEACDLKVGDELSTTDNRWIPIDNIQRDGSIATVYNMTVENWHTYFSGAPDWGFDIWVHNNHANATKVVGDTEVFLSRPHRNKTPGHWEAIVEETDAMAATGDYVRVYGNKGLRREVPDIDMNRRPDAWGVRHDGLIDQIEVPSKTDLLEDLMQRMRDTQVMLGERAGTINIVFPKEV